MQLCCLPRRTCDFNGCNIPTGPVRLHAATAAFQMILLQFLSTKVLNGFHSDVNVWKTEQTRHVKNVIVELVYD